MIVWLHTCQYSILIVCRAVGDAQLASRLRSVTVESPVPRGNPRSRSSRSGKIRRNESKWIEMMDFPWGSPSEPTTQPTGWNFSPGSRVRRPSLALHSWCKPMRAMSVGLGFLRSPGSWVVMKGMNRSNMKQQWSNYTWTATLAPRVYSKSTG